MEVTVEFFAYLIRHSPKGERRVDVILKEGSTLKDLFEEIKIPPQAERICLLNGAYHSEETVLHQGDVISLYPMIDGG
jgi:molybdopterin converting factor small subunit